MKLDRNDPGFCSGKYALLKLRVLNEFRSGTFGVLPENISNALTILEEAGVVDWGARGTASEFFVMRLGDKYAADGLASYAAAAQSDDPEWAAEVAELAGRASLNSPFCKIPD